MDSIEEAVLSIAQRAHQIAPVLAVASTEAKNQALLRSAEAIKEHGEQILEANQKDLAQGHQKGLSAPMLDRLKLTKQTITQMAEGILQVAELADPIGEITDLRRQPSGIQVGRMRVPLGVIGIIYESRPNVTAEAATLCIKSGNAVILRGGSEAFYSNQAIASCISQGLHESDLPPASVQIIPMTDRAAVDVLVSLPKYIDLIVPRGGKSLVEHLMRVATIPLLKHLDGICHVYIDVVADIDKAIRIADNAKTQRYGTCNTMETLLLHSQILDKVLPPLAAIYQQKSVELRGDERICARLKTAQIATLEDWSSEYLAPILSIKVVDNLDEAIRHINYYGSHHTDAIVTENLPTAMRFLREVDSASVMVNASTRFADGFEYGLGAEMGISNDKLHARGPVGLEGLTSVKWVVIGDGHIRQ